MTIRLFLSIFLVGILFASIYPDTSNAAETTTRSSEFEATSVHLKAVSAKEIEFVANNGRMADGILPETVMMPHLVLHRNGILTPPEERTLILEVRDLQIPSPGVTITLKIETEHGDPDRGGATKHRIPVWQESRWVASAGDDAQGFTTVSFVHEFQDRLSPAGSSLSTPTGYFRYKISVTDGGHPSSSSIYFSSDFAFLMEDQWVVDLPEVSEASPGAAPDELVVYFADMFPYRLGVKDHSSQLLREAVPGFVRDELAPAMLAAFRFQSDEWGFTWRPEWTSYRSDQDAERLSVALTGLGVWYHGRTPGTAHAGISINTSAREYANYDNLAAAITSVFNHELFHSMQRNINQAHGGDGRVNGKKETLAFFAEGMAVLASTVAQQELEFSPQSKPLEYFSKANLYIAGNEFYSDHLNVSYAEMDPYLAALYWRFLYEKCSFEGANVSNPSAGMGVMRRTLEEVYIQTGENESDEDIVALLPEVMNRVLQSSGMESCPFSTYEDSLTMFSQAIYSLRIEGGRCEGIAIPSGCGLYDPGQNYEQPAVENLPYAGAGLTYSGAIASSFGMDFMDVVIAAGMPAQPVQVKITSQSAARFSVQLIPQVNLDTTSIPVLANPQVNLQTIEVSAGQVGKLCYLVPDLDLEADNRLGLIITRLDTNEKMDPSGSYAIDIHQVLDCGI